MGVKKKKSLSSLSFWAIHYCMKNTSNLKHVDSLVLLFHFIFSISSTLVVNAGYLSWNLVFSYKTPEPGEAYATPKQDWLLLALCVYRMPCLTSWWGPSNLKSRIRTRNTKHFLAAFVVWCESATTPRFQGPENPGRLTSQTARLTVVWLLPELPAAVRRHAESRPVMKRHLSRGRTVHAMPRPQPQRSAGEDA